MRVLPEAMRLQRVDHTSDELRKLMEGWDNRLSRRRLSLPEAYLDGRMVIALIVEVGAASSPDHSRRLPSDAPEGAPDEGRRIIVVLNRLEANLCDKDGWNKQGVFVHPVELIERQQTVPSAVRFLEIGNDLGDVGRCPLYRSVMTLTFKRLPVFVDGEMQVGVRDGPRCAGSFMGDIVQRGSQVVYSIPDDLRPTAWEVAKGGSHEHRWMPGLRVSLHPDRVGARLEVAGKPFLKLSDVLVGPFDLRLRSEKCFASKRGEPVDHG